MKKYISAFVFCSLLIFNSCESTKLSGIKENNSKKDDVIELQVEPVKTEAELYEESIKGVKLSVISKPSAVIAGSSFKNPYTVKVDKDGQPLEGFSVLIRYPSAKKNGIVEFSETTINTDSSGYVTFMPEKTSFSCDSSILFMPNPKSEDNDVIKLAEKLSVTEKYQVKTKLRSSGIISLVDYNLNEKPLSDTFSSSLLLKNLMNKGFSSVGNFDIPRNLTGNPDAIYRHVHGIVGNSLSFLIFGSVKYSGPVTKEDGLYSCTLEGKISCMDLKTGEILYSTVKTVTEKDSSDWKAVNAARVKLSEEIGNAVNLNM